MKKLLKNPAFLLICTAIVALVPTLDPQIRQSIVEAAVDATLPRTIPFSQKWTMVSVADGNTIIVKQENETKKIRLCGIDAVEEQQKLGSQAKSYLRSLIDKGDGTVSITPIEQDRDGRMVAEVFVLPRPRTPGYRSEEEIFLNGDMVRAGFARYTGYSDNCPNELVIKQSQQMAIANRVGVWSQPK